MEEHSVELRAEPKAVLLVPRERRLHGAGLVHVAEVTCEGGHVVGGVGELQHCLAHDFGYGLRAEADALVALGRYDGKLLKDVLVQVT